MDLIDAPSDPKVRARMAQDTKRAPTTAELIFGGGLMSCVHCQSCGHDSITYDPAMDISLEINKVVCTPSPPL